MENNLFLSILNWNEIEPIINKFQMKRETFNILRNANTSGYDLIMNYINNKFLDNIGLNSLHEKNLINQQISNFVIDLLKIKFLYQNKLYFIQLDLDIDYTIEELTKNIKNLFNINNEIYLTVHSQMNFNNNKNIKEVLLPNFKIIKHIIENPEKYFIFEIYEPKENYINFNFNNSNYNSYFSFDNNNNNNINNNNNNLNRKNNNIYNSNLNSQDISYNNSLDLTSVTNNHKNTFNNPEIINNYNNLNNKKHLNINNALDIDENPLLNNSQSIYTNREKDFRDSKETKKLNNSNSCGTFYTPNNRNYLNKEINKNKKMNCILNNNLHNMNYNNNNNMNNNFNNNNCNYQKNNNNNSEFNIKREKERMEINNYVKKGYGINDNKYNQENNNNKISDKKIYNSHTPDNRKDKENEIKNMNQKNNNNELNNSLGEIYINKNNYRNSHTSKREYKYNKIKINDDKNAPTTDRSNKSMILNNNNNNNNYNQNNENYNNENNNNNDNNKEDNLHSKIKMMKNQISELSSNILNDNKENNNIISNNDEKNNIENIKNNNLNNNVPIKIINTGITRRSYIDNYKSDNLYNNFQLKHLTNKYGGYGLNSNSPIKNDNYLKVSYNYEKKNIKNNVSNEDYEKE